MSYTIVIPYKDEVHKGLELKYSLRSIEKFLIGWSDIILIGDNFPEWFKGQTHYCIEIPAHKNYNIYNKLLSGIEFCEVSENFIMWHDDHWLLKPLHVSQIANWNNGPLRDELKRLMGGRYRRAVEGTLEEIPEALNYDIHVPIVFNKQKFKEIFEGKTKELCVKSYYCYHAGVEGAFMRDLKIPWQVPFSEIKQRTEDRLFLSIDSAAIGHDMIKFWEELYPEPSKFEK